MHLVLKLVVFTFFASFYSLDSKDSFLECKKETSIVSTIECGDLLSRYAKKPEKLRFVDCTVGEGQVVLEAKYSVSGKDSKAVEKFLVKKYGMGKLKFVCCGWESKDGKSGQINNLKAFKDYPNYSIMISMFASAEKGTDESSLELDRNEVEEFTVLVEIVDV
jgi:hypothetical protein